MIIIMYDTYEPGDVKTRPKVLDWSLTRNPIFVLSFFLIFCTKQDC